MPKAQSLAERLEPWLKRKRADRPLAVLDLDKTIIQNDCGEAFFHFLVEQGKLPESRIREYYEKVENEGGIIAYPWVVSLLTDMKEADLYAACQEAIRRELKKEIGKKELGGVPVAQGIRLYPQMKQIMKRMKQVGFELWIISASNRWVVETTIRELKLPVDHFVGMEVIVKDGILTNIPVKPQPVAAGKREVIERKIGRSPNFVAGDSLSDFPMLEMAAEIALFIDHGKKECQKIAKEKGWLIQPAFEIE